MFSSTKLWYGCMHQPVDGTRLCPVTDLQFSVPVYAFLADEPIALESNKWIYL